MAAETIGIIAAIAQFVDVSFKIVHYVNTCGHASEQQAQLGQEACAGVAVLTSLKQRLDNPEEEASPWRYGIETSLAEPLSAAVNDLRRLVEELVAPKSRVKKIGSALVWPNKQKEIEDAIKRVHRVKSLADSALQNRVSDTVTEIKADMAVVMSAAQKNLLDRIFAFIAPYDFSAKYQDALATRTPGTGEWFVQGADFKAWLETDSSLLWCPGKLGAGKTVICSVAIQHLQTRQQEDNGHETAVAFAFSSHNEQDLQTPEALLLSLWRQLMSYKDFDEIQCADLERKFLKPKSRPPLDTIKQMLSGEARRYRRVFVVIDALDELEENTRWTLLKALQDTGLNVLATSRNECPEALGFRDVFQLRILAQDYDLRLYTKRRIALESRLSRLIRQDKFLAKDIESTIIRKSDGIFLLGRLHIDTISSLHTSKMVRRTLGNLPEGDNAVARAYDQAMERIRSQDAIDRDLAKRVLACLFYAQQNLSLIEMQHAVAIDLENDDYNDDESLDETNLVSADLIVSVCAGLAIVETSAIQFVHFTTREYFRSIISAGPDAPTSAFAREILCQGHLMFAKICLAYLSLQCFSDKRLQRPISEQKIWAKMKQFPLLKYAVANWGHHARGALRTQPETWGVSVHEGTVLNCISNRFDKLRASSPHLALPTRILICLRYLDDPYGQTPFGDLKERSPKGQTVLPATRHINMLSYFGLKEVARRIWEEAPGSLTKQGDKSVGNAVHWAILGDQPLSTDQLRTDQICTDQLSTIEVLLNAEPRLLEGHVHRCTPAHLAARRGNPEILAYLISQGADLMATTRPEGGAGARPLHQAAASGNALVVEKILADPVGRLTLLHKDFFERTPLHWASQVGTAASLRPLLAALGATGEDVSNKRAPLERDHDGGTVVRHAVKRGDLESVEVILQSAWASQFLSIPHLSLYTAIEFGNTQVVRALLEWALNQDELLPSTWLEGCLFRAALAGQFDVAKLLLEQYSSHLNLTEGLIIMGKTLLEASIHGASAPLTSLIIDSVPSAESCLQRRDDSGRTPLLQAAQTGCAEICLSLIEKGANVQVQDRKGNSALHYAASMDLHFLVASLIKAGAAMTICNEQGQTPWMLARQSSSQQALNVLAEAGAAPSETFDIKARLVYPLTSQHQITAAALIRQAFQSLPDSQSRPDLSSESLRCLVSCIIDWAEYWVPSKTQRVQPLRVTRDDAATPYVQSRPVRGRSDRPVKKIVMNIDSADQGWSDYSHSWGTYRDSHTWFHAWLEPRSEEDRSSEGITAAAKSEGPMILRNVHARKSMKHHRVRWLAADTPGHRLSEERPATPKPREDGQGDEGDVAFHFHSDVSPQAVGEWVRDLRPGDRIGIVPKARYLGWMNRVGGADMTVFTTFVDDNSTAG